MSRTVTQSAQVCLAKAADILKNGDVLDTESSIDDLEALVEVAQGLGMEPTLMKDWPEVDAALAAHNPVILTGDAMANRAHGRRLKMDAEGINFLLLSERVSTMFPTSGGPFAVETVSYLAHDPHYQEGPVWVCLGELRGYCDAASHTDVLGVALSAAN